MDNNNKELEDFVGDWAFPARGVDYEGGEDGANAIRFCLNGIIYRAMEDRNDGYRSMLGTISEHTLPMTNTFHAIPVTAHMSNSSSEHCIQFVSTYTGKIVLEVGTSYSDEYYPSFVACWQPENM